MGDIMRPILPHFPSSPFLCVFFTWSHLVSVYMEQEKLKRTGSGPRAEGTRVLSQGEVIAAVAPRSERVREYMKGGNGGMKTESWDRRTLRLTLHALSSHRMWRITRTRTPCSLGVVTRYHDNCPIPFLADRRRGSSLLWLAVVSEEAAHVALLLSRRYHATIWNLSFLPGRY